MASLRLLSSTHDAMSETLSRGSPCLRFTITNQKLNPPRRLLRSSDSAICWTKCLSDCGKLQRISTSASRQQTRKTSKVFTIKCAIGRRHHKRRDEDFKAHPRLQQQPLEPKKSTPYTGNERAEGSSESLVITVDFDQMKYRAAGTATSVYRTADRLFGEVRRSAKRSMDGAVHLAQSAAEESHEAWTELSTSVRIERDRNFVVSVKLPPIIFAAKVLLGCIFVMLLPKLLMNANRRLSWWWSGSRSNPDRLVRDRSLAGKEIPVTKTEPWEFAPIRRSPRPPRSSKGPLDVPLQENSRSEKEMVRSSDARGASSSTMKKARKLPGWWPGPDLPPSSPIASRRNAEEQANRLVQGIMQKRLSGLDFQPADILQLRQLCKSAGAKVKFDTNNTRDSFFRAAITVVLSACQSPGRWAVAEFGSEGCIGFIAGLADNIALESEWAATMVAAAVAARTRAGLLQAIALHLQSKVTESDEELLKLIRLHESFPVDPDSAEIEMVARGLGSHFDEEGRLELLQAYERLGGFKTKRIAEAALGFLPLADR